MPQYASIASCVAIAMASSQAVSAPQQISASNAQSPLHISSYAGQPVKKLEHFLTATYRLVDRGALDSYAKLFPEQSAQPVFFTNPNRNALIETPSKITPMQTFYDRQISVSLVDGPRVTLRAILSYEIGSFTDEQKTRTFHIIRKFKPHPVLERVTDLLFTAFIEEGKSIVYILPDNEETITSTITSPTQASFRELVDESGFKEAILKMMGR